jgi:hypothetical protein
VWAILESNFNCVVGNIRTVNIQLLHADTRKNQWRMERYKRSPDKPIQQFSNRYVFFCTHSYVFLLSLLLYTYYIFTYVPEWWSYDQLHPVVRTYVLPLFHNRYLRSGETGLVNFIDLIFRRIYMLFRRIFFRQNKYTYFTSTPVNYIIVRDRIFTLSSHYKYTTVHNMSLVWVMYLNGKVSVNKVIYFKYIFFSYMGPVSRSVCIGKDTT